MRSVTRRSPEGAIAGISYESHLNRLINFALLEALSMLPPGSHHGPLGRHIGGYKIWPVGSREATSDIEHYKSTSGNGSGADSTRRKALAPTRGPGGDPENCPNVADSRLRLIRAAPGR